MRSFSTSSFKLSIKFLNCDVSFDKIEAVITGRETPQARPRAVLLGTKTYGTFYEETSKDTKQTKQQNSQISRTLEKKE